ncbi:ATP-binding protein [Streptomyces sp. NPDC127074]|uniref:ATP-binding protein n=1 Tax=Streptomyces sp. NPDC127074 TaxID=3347130 RepID=UPI003651DC5B
MVHVTDLPGDESEREPLGRLVLCPVHESVPRARRWFRAFIAKEALARSTDDCLLLISELVTNAIVYGESDGLWRVRVEWYRAGASLRVEVHNPGFPARVRLRRPAAREAHGRGLWIVNELADEWWSGPSPYSGTVVGFLMHKMFASSSQDPEPGRA